MIEQLLAYPNSIHKKELWQTILGLFMIHKHWQKDPPNQSNNENYLVPSLKPIARARSFKQEVIKMYALDSVSKIKLEPQIHLEGVDNNELWKETKHNKE